MGLAPDAECFHTAAQVTNAHGAGKCIAVHLAEGLYLHGAGEGDEGVGQQIQLLRQKAHDEEHQDLEQHHQLTPVEPLHPLELEADELSHKNAPLARKQLDGHQHDVAGLGVGEDLAAV